MAPVSLRKFLEMRPVEASAPCRIDAGGTWDIKAMALPLEGIQPATVNMALNMRTEVTLKPLLDGWVGISSLGFRGEEKYPYEKMPFDSRFGLFFAALSHFKVSGVHVEILSRFPVKSALGGSSTALVALIKALVKTKDPDAGVLSKRDILHLGYHLEDGVSGGYCGIQDQAAAVYGGANLWKWTYGKNRSLFKREQLLDAKGQKEISKRILVAFSGKNHSSLRINRSWIKGFLSGETRQGWIAANETTHRLAHAIRGKDWKSAIAFMKEEMDLRRKITPHALIPITGKLIHIAEEIGCGARFTGAGAGGSVWALGDRNSIPNLKARWEKVLKPIRQAGVLECSIDPVGVK